MGVFDIITNRAERTEKAAEQIKYKLIHHGFIHRGHSVFEYNEDSGELKRIERDKDKSSHQMIDKRHTLLKAGTIVKREGYIAKPNCIYIAALNRKNAIDKLRKDHNIIL